MELKTLKQLRALAKQRGLSGYSALSKKELVRSLKKSVSTIKRRPRATRARSASPAPKKPAARQLKLSVPLDGATPSQRWWDSEPAAAEMRFDGEEERIEGVKYALTRGAVTGTALLQADLGEDIDRLPTLPHSALRLLAQKPGVLHAYWTLAERDASVGDLTLRLYRFADGSAQPWQEIPVPGRRGHWYFHIGDAADTEVMLQLGFYRDGRFVSAIRGNPARVPSLYASTRSDPRWWIGAGDFRDMYLRAGGFARGSALGWRALGSSSAAPGPAAPEQLGWPGGISS